LDQAIATGETSANFHKPPGAQAADDNHRTGDGHANGDPADQGAPS